MVFLFVLLILLFSIYSLKTKQNIEPKDFYLDWVDEKTSPADNFYLYANGNWLKNNIIPADDSLLSQITIQNDRNASIVKKIISNLLINKKLKPGSIEQKVTDFYLSGMDEKLINKLGASPLKSEFLQIESIINLEDLQKTIAHLHLICVKAIFSLSSTNKLNSEQNFVGINAAELTMLDPVYYLKKDAFFRNIKTIITKDITKMFELLGDDPKKAITEANIVMKIETTLAKNNLNAEYKIFPMNKLSKITSDFSWSLYFQDIGMSKIDMNIILIDSGVIKTLSTLKMQSIDNWKVYLRWCLINEYSRYLSQPFLDIRVHSRSVLFGFKKPVPRDEFILMVTSEIMGNALGQLYIKNYVLPSKDYSNIKSQVLDITDGIRTALLHCIKTSWMTKKTRKYAIKKLDAMKVDFFYPKKWVDYSKLVINRNSFVQNIMHSNKFLIQRELQKIGKPTDKNEWLTVPQNGNAFYSNSLNLITIPFGILQPPIFDINSPISVNYGSLGYVIGHEMSHAFDNIGVLYDEHGNVNDGWTSSDFKKFKQKLSCIVNQFSTYPINKILMTQGEKVAGEAMADLSGLILAYRAFHSSKDYRKSKIINGITPDQQFFLGFAHARVEQYRPEYLNYMGVNDTHPLGIYRVNGTVANMPEFQNAFNIPNNSPMVNKHRCSLW